VSVEAVAALVAGYGVAARPVRGLIARLAEGRATLPQLVAATGLPRREVEAAIRALADDADHGPGGVTIRAERAEEYRDRFGYAQLGRTAPADPLAARLADNPDLLADLAALTAGVPPPLRALDHVPATPETAARRALWLDGTFDLAGARLLCVGDHDLTGLAAALANPALAVTVVDLDERLLEYVDAQAAKRGLDVRCLYADLRHGLPPAAQESADLVFTDPPYTPEGVRLFVARGLAGLRDREHGRVVVAYGYGGQPGLGAKVQQAIHGLHLAYEAVLPGFNRYVGAEAIGSASDLYVCRPTARTWRALEHATGEAAHIYTHGPQSVEAAPPPPDHTAAPRPAAIGDGGIPLADVLAGTAAARLPRPRVIDADLAGDPGGWLLRLLLALDAEALSVLVPNNHPHLASEHGQRELAGLVGTKYALRFLRSTPDNHHAIVRATAVDPASLAPADRAVRYVLDHANARLGTSWRDGLVRASRAGDAPLDRAAATALSRAAVPDPGLLDLRPVEIPRHRLAELLELIRASAR
jgi:hypothetical protein